MIAGLNQWNSALLEKPGISHVVDKFLAEILLSFHKCSTLVSVLSQMCPIHKLPTCLFKIHFNSTAISKNKSFIFFSCQTFK
jgi:hypothetical protein